MSITNFDDAPQSGFLERFKPTENVPYRAYVLDWNRKVEASFHFIEKSGDTPGGMYECSKGECCAVLGAPGQAIMIPLWVYTNPTVNPNEGSLFTWNIPRALYKSLVTLKRTLAAQGLNIADYDFQITATKQGQGTNQNAMPLPGKALLLTSVTQETYNNAFGSVDMWLTLADTTSYRKVAPGGWGAIFQKHHIGAALPGAVAGGPPMLNTRPQGTSLPPPPPSPVGPSVGYPPPPPTFQPPQAPQQAPPIWPQSAPQQAPQQALHGRVYQQDPQGRVYQQDPQQAPQQTPQGQVGSQQSSGPVPTPVQPTSAPVFQGTGQGYAQQSFAQPAGFQPGLATTQPFQAPPNLQGPPQAEQPRQFTEHVVQGDELSALIDSDFPGQNKSF
jgi:hypothetical protein